MEPSTVGMSAGTARFPPAAACPDLLRARLDKRTRPVRCSRVTPACHTLAPSRLQPRRGISFQGVTILAFREETADAASPRMMMGQSQVELPVRFPHFPTAVHILGGAACQESESVAPRFVRRTLEISCEAPILTGFVSCISLLGRQTEYASHGSPRRENHLAPGSSPRNDDWSPDGVVGPDAGRELGPRTAEGGSLLHEEGLSIVRGRRSPPHHAHRGLRRPRQIDRPAS